MGRVAASTVLTGLEGGRAADVRSQQTSARYASATEYYQAKLADGAAAMRRVLLRLKKDDAVWLSDTDAIRTAAGLK